VYNVKILVKKKGSPSVEMTHRSLRPGGLEQRETLGVSVPKKKGTKKGKQKKEEGKIGVTIQG